VAGGQVQAELALPIAAGFRRPLKEVIQRIADLNAARARDGL